MLYAGHMEGLVLDQTRNGTVRRGFKLLFLTSHEISSSRFNEATAGYMAMSTPEIVRRPHSMVTEYNNEET